MQHNIKHMSKKIMVAKQNGKIERIIAHLTKLLLPIKVLTGTLTFQSPMRRAVYLLSGGMTKKIKKTSSSP